MPPELQALGGDMIQAFPEFIKQGGEPKDFEVLVSQPEILASLQDVYKLRDEIANYKRDLIAQGYSSDKVKELLIEKMINSKQPNFTLAKQVDAQGLVEFTQQPPTIEPVSTIIPLAGADTAEAEFGKDKISVSNESNVGIDIFTKVGQVKQKIDKTVESTGIDPQKASLALGLVLGGPVNLAKSVVTDYLYGDKVAELNERVVDEITAFIFNTDYDQIQSIKNSKNQSSNETAKKLVGQQELTADGINLTTSVVLGASAAVGIGKGVAKGKEENISTNSSSIEIKVPDYVTRNDHDFSATENYKGKPKAYINENGDLVAANPDGIGSIQSHIRGSNPEKTPYISTTDPKFSQESKNYGGEQIQIDTKRLQQDIDAGKIKNTQIIPHQDVKRELQSKVDAAKEKYDRNPSDKNEKSLTKAEQDLNNAIRDGECLIKGCIPADYIKK